MADLARVTSPSWWLADTPAIRRSGGVLRVTCPGRRDLKGFEVSSDGPDGLPGGLDRVE